MSEWLLDTAFVIALVNSQDSYHTQAKNLAERIKIERIQVIVTQAVMLEIASALARPPFREPAIRIIGSFHTDSQVVVIRFSERLLEESWELYKQRADKSWSWVDCISFIIMKERGLKDALTADKHFEQAGFVALLRASN